MIRVADGDLCVDPSLPFLSLIGKKYTILILGVIGNQDGGVNFNEILRDIPFSSSTIVSKRLKELSDHGIISRFQDSDRVTYSLTSSGKLLRASLIPLIKVLDELGKENDRRFQL